MRTITRPEVAMLPSGFFGLPDHMQYHKLAQGKVLKILQLVKTVPVMDQVFVLPDEHVSRPFPLDVIYDDVRQKGGTEYIFQAVRLHFPAFEPLAAVIAAKTDKSFVLPVKFRNRNPVHFSVQIFKFSLDSSVF